MKVNVGRDKCQGCGLCESDVPDVFALGYDGRAKVLIDMIPTHLENAVKEAIDNCPEQAIEST